MINFNNNNNHHITNNYYIGLDYIHRILASSSSSSSSSSSYSYKIDYNVLSVAAMTLALIMMVEYGRHRLDHWAYLAATRSPTTTTTTTVASKHSKSTKKIHPNSNNHNHNNTAAKQPLYRAALEGIYAELATLGIVEFVLHLIEEYYPSYDKNRKSVFADVHFLLFYTAIINALFSVVTAMIVTKIIQQLWVHTESFEMYHYNEIQQTFVQIQNELNTLHHHNYEHDPKKKQHQQQQKQSDTDPEVGDDNHNDDDNNNNNNGTVCDDPWSMGQKKMNLRGLYTSVMDQIRYPHIKYQYDVLLSQLRFHDLRTHVIQSYQLPKQIRISQYLIRCNEQTVLMKLIHVSSVAWLLLTVAVCILYFVLGIVFYKFEDQTLIGTTLSYVFLCWMLSFVLLCFILSNKMKSIFNTLLHSTELWDVTTSDIKEKERLAQQQLSLFWYSEPTIVIKLIQFMQFGYAASLSTLIVYWKDIDSGSIHMYWYATTLIICYLLFIHTIVHAIPRYTLCTTLGQLVNQKYLRETVALYRLNEAKQKEVERFYDNMNDQYHPKHHQPDVDDGNGDTKNINHLNSSVIVINRDTGRYANIAKTMKTEIEKTISDDATDVVKQVHDETAPPLQNNAHSNNVAAETTTFMNNEQVNDWLGGGSENVNISTKLYVEHVVQDRDLPSNESAQTLLHGTNNTASSDPFVSRMLDPIQSFDCDDDGNAITRSNSSQQLKDDDDDVELDDRKVHEQQVLTNLNDSSNHASMDVENILNNNNNCNDDNENNERFANYSEVLNKYCKYNDNDDDLFVSYPENILTASKTPITTTPSRQLPRKGSRRSLMSMITNQKQPEKTSSSSLYDRICNYAHSYFTSERHIEISNVYGAIVAFFFVGQRVEGFIHSQEIVSSSFLSFHYRLDVTFWLLTTWFSMFISASILIIGLLWSYGDFQTTKGCKLGASALIDFIISTVCLVVFFVAELERCCVSETDPTEILYRSSFDDPGPIPCSCPQFGTRKYGGLGTIEPYVSLVFLRIMRHWVARKIMKVLRQKYDWPKVKVGDDGDQHEKQHLAKSTHQMMKFGGHETMNHLNNVSIVTEMWEATIGANPDVAAKYGEFSGEILRAMLGLSVSIDEHAGETNIVSADSMDSNCPETTNPSSRRQLYALQQRYSGLSPEAQEIILSGKLGRRMIQASTSILEKTSSPLSRNSLSRNKSVMFEIGNYDPPNNEDHNYNFISPRARLLHSMRRCDRKFLPFLAKWTTVDVLITRFEVVYLEVVTDDSSSNNEDSAALECIREALQATKGGKGLRLCDVVAGRRVTGRVGLADITCLFVERHLPYNDEDCVDDAFMSIDGPTEEVEAVEYWKRLSTRPSLQNSFNQQSRAQQWCHVREDHLKMETASGTLMLRFFADLEDAKHYPEHSSADFEARGGIFQNNALQWVKSIANYCGPEQLTKQDLPHFGEDTSDELRDYLVFTDRKVKKRHLRVRSDGIDNMMSTRLSFRGISRPNLMQRMIYTRALSANATVDRNLPRQFVAAGTSSNMNGEPSSSMLPNRGGNANDPNSEDLPVKNRKVSFSQLET